jgi:hypothetical protein
VQYDNLPVQYDNLPAQYDNLLLHSNTSTNLRFQH